MKRDSVCVLSKSLGRCISEGTLNREVGGTLEKRLEAVEVMVGGSGGLGGNTVEMSRNQQGRIWPRRSAADVQIGLIARVGRG
jgi:hypothetical protein